MAKKRASLSKGQATKKSAKRSPPKQPEKEKEQKVKVEEMPVKVEKNAEDPPAVKTEEVAVKVEKVEERVLNFPPKPTSVPSFDRDFSPPDDYVPSQQNKQWTPDVALIGAVDEFFSTVAGSHRRNLQFNPLACNDEIRGEYRNMFVVATAADKHNEIWENRLDDEEKKTGALQQANKALRESLISIRIRKKAAIEMAKKYSVDDATQKAAIDLTNIRYEELTMDMSMECDGLFDGSQEPQSDNEMDMTMSSCGRAKYGVITGENALAKRCLTDVGRLVEKTKKRIQEKKRLQKKEQQLDLELAKLAAELRTERRNIGNLSLYVDEVLESAAWKEKNC